MLVANAGLSDCARPDSSGAKCVFHCNGNVSVYCTFTVGSGSRCSFNTLKS